MDECLMYKNIVISLLKVHYVYSTGPQQIIRMLKKPLRKRNSRLSNPLNTQYTIFDMNPISVMLKVLEIFRLSNIKVTTN